jgi:hypothetical protein
MNIFSHRPSSTMARDIHLPEQDIQAYLDLLRPVLLSDNTTCPLCLEPYVAFSADSVTDYPARPGVQWSGFQCNHVFGRVCIEQHIRSGEEYSVRCPICREAWFNVRPMEPGEYVLDIGGHRIRRRRRNALVPSSGPHRYEDDSADEADVSSLESEWSTVMNGDDGDGVGGGVGVVRRLRFIIEMLEVLQGYYVLQEMDEEEVVDIREAVHILQRLSDRRSQR